MNLRTRLERLELEAANRPKPPRTDDDWTEEDELEKQEFLELMRNVKCQPVTR